LGYMKVAFPLMLMSIVVSTVYLLFWHHYHGLVSLLGTLAAGALIWLVSIPVNNLLLRTEETSAGKVLSGPGQA
ncbi:hypothetical protein GFC01_11595, partial [Desulfofundulus thermobenzoicus]|nr:hypothetical protein [Desulfofundulus thermobenzoicus]